MLSISCIVVDDEPLARELLETHIGAIPFLEHKGSFKNAILAADFLQQHTVDLIFLDIQMPMLTGIDFIKSQDKLPAVIFTTAYREYAVESYELQIVDYLLKPIAFDRFFKAIGKFQKSQQSATNQPVAAPEAAHLFVNVNKKQIKLLFDEITHIESAKDYLKIHRSGERLLIKEALRQFITKLPTSHFLQVHRSYIVNTDKITAFTQQDIEIGDIEIPIGGLYKEGVLRFLKG